MGHIHFKKLIKFRKFIEIFHCCMTRLRNTNLGVFIQCQYTKTILRSKNMGQSMFTKHSKFQNFDRIFYCGMIRLRNTRLGVSIQCQYTRTILRNKNMGQTLFKKHSKLQKFRWNILLWHAQIQEHEFGCFYTMSIHKNHSRKQKYGTESVWETLKNIQNF